MERRLRPRVFRGTSCEREESQGPARASAAVKSNDTCGFVSASFTLSSSQVHQASENGMAEYLR
jgi:hypothetical protein